MHSDRTQTIVFQTRVLSCPGPKYYVGAKRSYKVMLSTKAALLSARLNNGGICGIATKPGAVGAIGRPTILRPRQQDLTLVWAARMVCLGLGKSVRVQTPYTLPLVVKSPQRRTPEPSVRGMTQWVNIDAQSGTTACTHPRRWQRMFYTTC